MGRPTHHRSSGLPPLTYWRQETVHYTDPRAQELEASAMKLERVARGQEQLSREDAEIIAGFYRNRLGSRVARKPGRS
jgi:hypothetical protein